MFSFCCVDVVDNLLYKVNIVCLLIYFLNLLSYSSKNSLFPWSAGQKVERGVSFVQERPFYLMCSQPNLHELARNFDARNLRKKLVHVSCAIYLTVCHRHYCFLWTIL